MRAAALFVVILLVLAAVPAHGDEARDPPELMTRVVEEGIKLEWTTPDGPPETIEATEVWRYEATVSTIDLGAEAAGGWVPHEIPSGRAAFFVDERPEATEETFYFIRIAYSDGSVSEPSNPSSARYPHCGWLWVGVPPRTQLQCLFPPPFVGDGLLEAA